MARYVARVRTPCSLSEAFALVSDMRTFPTWDPGVTAVKQVAGDGPGLGAAYDLRASAVPRDLTLRYETVRFEAPTSPGAAMEVCLIARSSTVTSVDVITARPLEDGTEVVYDADLRLNGPLRVADLGLRAAFQIIGARAETGMRRALEGTSVPA